MAVDDGGKVVAEPAFIQDEGDVIRLGVAGHTKRQRAMTLQERGDAGDETGHQMGTHQCTVERLLGRAMGEDLVFGEILAEEFADDLVVPLAMHSFQHRIGGLFVLR